VLCRASSPVRNKGKKCDVVIGAEEKNAVTVFSGETVVTVVLSFSLFRRLRVIPRDREHHPPPPNTYAPLPSSPYPLFLPFTLNLLLFVQQYKLFTYLGDHSPFEPVIPLLPLIHSRYKARQDVTEQLSKVNQPNIFFSAPVNRFLISSLSSNCIQIKPSLEARVILNDESIPCF